MSSSLVLIFFQKILIACEDVTQFWLVNALEVVKNKRDTNPPKKYGNIPL